MRSWGGSAIKPSVRPSGRRILPKAKSIPTGVALPDYRQDLIDQVFEGDSTPYDARLPGHGDRPDSCGQAVVKACPSCGHCWEDEYSCNRRECPECWQKWLSREAEESAIRLWVLTRKVYLGKTLGRFRAGRIAHVVISFKRQGLSYAQARKKAYRIAEKHGICGGAVIFHPFRTDEEGQYIPDGYVHYHVVGLAKGEVVWPSPGSNLPYVFKHVPDPTNGDKKTYLGVRKFANLLRLIRYQLSHAGLVQGTHALTWFGVLTYNQSVFGVKFGSKERFTNDYPEVSEYLNKYRKGCPECGFEKPLTVYNDRDADAIRAGLGDLPDRKGYHTLSIQEPATTADYTQVSTWTDFNYYDY